MPRWRSAATAWCGCARAASRRRERAHERRASSALRRAQLALPLRFALRELRGGLRGFCVFIACIALGVVAIAGVGSFARSLADGLAREGRVILGGDLSFSLIQREASAAERAFLDDARPRLGRRHACARWRAPPTAQPRWSRSRRSTAPIRCTATVALEPRMPLAGARASATARSAPPPIRRCWRGSISSRGARITVGDATIEIRAALDDRARQARRRHRLRPAPADQRGGAARDRPAPARQPGALALPAAAAGSDASDRAARGRRRRRRRRNCRTPAGRSAPAPTPRRRSSATSSASRSSSRWSA